MNHRDSAILFDLDGTLIDTAPDFITTLNALLQQHRRPALSEASIRATVSNGARALVTLGFDLSPEHPEFAALHQQLLQQYSCNLAASSQLFPALDECLQWLEQQQLQWGIVTNKPLAYTTPLLTALGLQQRAAAVICPDHVSNTKPDPEPLLLACEQLQCRADRSIYIGDHARDIEAGKRAGMTTIAAAYGYLDQPQQALQWQADHLAEQPQQLLPILQRLLS